MAENKINLQRYAMSYGTYMGVYWILKFVLFPMGLSNSFYMLAFLVATLLVPLIGYYYTRKFRDTVCDGEISFFQSFIFLLFLYVFAALLAAVAHFIYFRYIDNGLVLDTYTSYIEASKAVPGFKEMMEQAQVDQLLEQFSLLKPIDITIQLLSQNIFYCSLLALLTSFFVMKKKKN